MFWSGLGFNSHSFARPDFLLKPDYLYNMEIKTCSKCKADLPLSEFQTYYHSTQKRTFRRGHCTKCLYSTRKKNKMDRLLNSTKIVPPVPLKQEPEVSKKINTKEKICITCFEIKSVDDYYTSRLTCKKCCLEKEQKYRTEKTYKSLDKNGGSMRVPNRPGNFHDEYQRHYTYEILIAMGWSLNEENGKWWKEGIKNKDGIFTNVKKYKRTQLDTPKYYTLEEKMEKVILGKELRNEGKTYLEISNIINISPPTVCKWLKEYEKK